MHVERYSTAVDTHLVQALNPGDTSFLVQSAKGWSNQSPDARTRALAWYDYRDRKGTHYSDYTYTRNVAKDSIDGLWDFGAIVGNRITLKKPWDGPVIPSGSAVRNALDNDSLIPALLDNGPVTQTGSATISGVWQNGKRQNNQFPPGTASVRFASLMNQLSAVRDEVVTVQLRYGSPPKDSTVGVPINNRRSVDLDVLANDSISSTAVIRSVTQGVRGSVSIISGNGAERRALRYISPNFFIGTDFFSYTIFDPTTGQESTEQVFLQSLGGNLDQDATLQESIRIESQVPKSLQGQIYLIGQAVKNEQRFVPEESDVARYPISVANITYVTLGYMLNQNGSLNLLPSGKFDFEPFKDYVGTSNFVLGHHNGSDQRIGTGGIRVFGDHSLRDQSRLIAIGLAEHNHESALKRLFYPPSIPLDSNNKPFLSWRVHALPYMGYQDLYNRFRQNEPWDGPNNLPLLAEMPDIYRSGTDSKNVTSTRYLALANGTYTSTVPLFLNNANGLGNKLKFANVTDGTTNTILVAQAAPEKAVPWTKPDDLVFDSANPLATLGNTGNYFNAVFADAQVRALPTDMGNAMFQTLATISGNDFLQDPASLTRAAKLRPDFPGDPIVLNDDYQSNAMRQLLLAMHNHESVYKRFPPFPPATTIKNLSWRVYLLPYLEQSTLFNQFRLDEPWDSPTNLAAADKMPDIFRSLGDSPTSNRTRFRVLGGPNMAYGSPTSLNQGPKLSDFVDETSNSMLIVEAGTDKAVPWTKPDVMPIMDGNIWNSLGLFNKSFMLTGMADGSVLRVPTTTPPDVVRGLATINLRDAGRTEFELSNGDNRSTNSFRLRNNLQQIGLAIHNFEDAQKQLPNDFIRRANQVAINSVGLSWRVAILPYIDQTSLYIRFHLDEPWDSPHNLSLLPLMPSIFKTATQEPFSTTTRLQRFQGRSTIDPKQLIKFSSITDGTSNTILAALSAPEKAVPWTKPADMEFSDTSGWEALGRNVLHTAVVMADGSTKMLDRSVGNLILNRMVRRNDGFAVSDDGGPNIDPHRTIVVREGGAIDALTLSGQMPAIVDFDAPGLAIAVVNSDGYNRGLGASLRVAVLAVDNVAVDGKRQTKLNVRTLSNPNDPSSPWKLLYSIDVIILDNDAFAIQTTSDVPLSVAEGSATEIWIRLSAQPTASVTVIATESDRTEIELQNRTLVFTPSDWSTPQRVVVQGVVDSILDGDIDSEIQFAVTASADVAFAAASPLVIPVSTRDNRPATLKLLDLVTSLSEDTLTTNRIPIGRVVISDDGIGTNTIALAGRDADLFLVENDILYLRAGVLLDFETKKSFAFSVVVDDPSVGGSPDAEVAATIQVSDVNEPPTAVSFTDRAAAVRENSATASVVAVRIVVRDDALGVNTIRLTGPDARHFNVSGTNLEFRPQGSLDYETQSTYVVDVVVSDDSIGGALPVSQRFSFGLVNVPEIVSVTDPFDNPITNSIQGIRIVWDTLIEPNPHAIRWWKRDIGAEVLSSVSTLHSSNRSVTNLVFSGEFIQEGKLLSGEYQLHVDGNDVRSLDTDTGADDSRSETYRVTPSILPAKLTLTQRGTASVSQRSQFEVSVVGANGSSRYTYRLDSNNDGVYDRVYLNATSPYLISDVQFERSGTQTVRAVAESQFIVQAVGELVVSVRSGWAGSASQWLSSLDTDRDGTVSPLDVLAVINHINANSGTLVATNFSLDVDRDSTISPLDVLAVVNHLNLGAPDDLAFLSLRMSNTGEQDGFTSQLSIDGVVADARNELFLSLNGGARRNATRFVQANGSFELTDIAMRDLFGEVRDGENTVSAFVREGSQFSFARDRRFYLQSESPGAPSIVTAMQLGSTTYLQWTRPAKDFNYDVFALPIGEQPRKLLSSFAGESAELHLTPGEYDLFVEAVTASKLRTRSKAVRVRVV